MNSVSEGSVRDDIRRLEPAAYERALQGFMAALQRVPGVVAIYQLGSVRFPGISDLDVIIVVDDRVPAGTDFKRIMRSSAGPDGSYIFSHSPYVIHEAGFHHLPTLFYADNLQHRWGRPLEFAAAPADEQAFFAYQIALEAAVGQSFAFLRALHNRAVPNLRSLLCNLNAVRHNFSTMARWSGSADRAHWSVYTQRIDRLRGEWYTLEHGVRVREAWSLMALARDILLEILGELAVLGVSKGYLRSGGRPAWMSLLDINVLLQFRPGETASCSHLVNPLGFLRAAPGLGPWLSLQPRWREMSNHVSVLTLPAALYPLISGWDTRPGPATDVLAARRLFAVCPATDDLPEATREWLNRKAERLNDYLSFMQGARLAGFLLLTPALWLQTPTSVPNRMKTRWNRLWVSHKMAVE